MDPYLGEVRCFGFGRIPTGWLACNGQLLPISSNQALYSLLGAQFGGDGRTNFALPNLQGYLPIHMNAAASPPVNVGAKSGAETVTLAISATGNQLPQHTHTVAVSDNTGDQIVPPAYYLSNLTAPHQAYAASLSTPAVSLAADTVASDGGGQQHTNMQPFLVLNFCIATMGFYPSRWD